MPRNNEYRAGDSLPGAERYLRTSSRPVSFPGVDAFKAVYMPVIHEDAVSELCRTLLKPCEIRRAERFTHAVDRHEYMQRRAFQRLCAALAAASRKPMADFEWKHDANGRPALREAPEINFSFASCAQGMVGAWSKSHLIGVDIEPLNHWLDVLAMGKQYFTPRELETLEHSPRSERIALFFRLWRIKEAALKAIGQGLPFGMDRFEILLEPEVRFLAVPEVFGDPRNFEIFECQGLPVGAVLVTRKCAKA